jgi:hypothetical protein
MTLENATRPVEASGGQSEQSGFGERAAGQAAEVAGVGAEGVGELAGEVRAQAKVVAGEFREQFDQFVGQAGDEVREQARQRSERAAGQLRVLSERMTALAEGRPQDAGPLAGYVDEVEQRVRGLATRLEQRGPQGVVEDVTGFARRRPGVFLAGAVGLGFVLGRVVRAGSAAQRSTSGTAQWSSPSSSGGESMRGESMAGYIEERLASQGNGGGVGVGW